jgi:hypothetical protein
MEMASAFYALVIRKHDIPIMVVEFVDLTDQGGTPEGGTPV